MSERENLIAKARELGCFDRPEERTDQQLRDAIEAEQAAAAWTARLDNLPTIEAKQAAIHRLRKQMQQVDTIEGRQGPTGRP